MNKQTSLIETDADYKRVWATLLLHGKIDDLVHKTPLEKKRAKLGSASDIIIKLAKSDMSGFISQKVDRIHSERD